MAPICFLLAAMLMPVAMATTSNCLTASLPGILDLGKCLTVSLDLCTATLADVLHAVICIVECLVTTLLTINVLGALAALIDILSVVLSVFGISLTGILKLLTPLCCVSKVPGCITLLSGDDVCTEPINITLPGELNLGQCLTNTLILCKAGEPVTDEVLVKLVKALACLLSTTLQSASGSVPDDLLCSLITLCEGAAAKATLALKLALGPIVAGLKAQLTVACG
uniref:23 kDa family member n=1 Tax=Rhipicephalus zambeziensis TaxID=60191 RepID=A0A224Y0R4_9ACAR